MFKILNDRFQQSLAKYWASNKNIVKAKESKKAYISVWELNGKYHLMAGKSVSHIGLHLPKEKGIVSLPEGCSKQKMGEALRLAQQLLLDIDSTGHLRRADELKQWNELKQIETNTKIWLSALLVGVFFDDESVEIYPSRHGDNLGNKVIGWMCWAKPFYDLKSPTDDDIGRAVFAAFKNSV